MPGLHTAKSCYTVCTLSSYPLQAYRLLYIYIVNGLGFRQSCYDNYGTGT